MAGNAAELGALRGGILGRHARGRGISLDDLLGNVRLEDGSVVVSNEGTLKQARARFERQHIAVAAILEQHHGRVTATPKTLGIQRPILSRGTRSLRLNSERPES